MGLGFGPAWSQTVPIPVPKPVPVSAAPAAAAAQDPIAALLSRTDSVPVPAAAPPMAIGSRLGETAERSRFVLELSDPVDVRVFTLTNPDRVVIDMPEILWRTSSDARPTGKGAIASYRYGLFRKGNTRIVIDLKSPVRVEKPQMLPPAGGFGFRLVLDLYPATAQYFTEHAGWPQEYRNAFGGPAVAAATPPPAAASSKPSTSGKKIVVVDAGHGGIDPGTHGASGLQEKAIVLGVAKYLRDALEAKGYKVVLTRDTDVFIPLRERVNIARAAHGDLFVSLHIDSNDHHDIRGASIYTLSESASDKEAAKLAEKENMSDIIAGVDLSGDNSPVASILIDLAQRDTMNRSARFAETVLDQLPSATLVRPSSPHRSAGFAVLKGPDIPAALVELGYLSNPDDEALMKTNVWRKKVAGAVAEAVDKHFSGQQELTAAVGDPPPQNGARQEAASR